MNTQKHVLKKQQLKHGGRGILKYIGGAVKVYVQIDDNKF